MLHSVTDFVMDLELEGVVAALDDLPREAREFVFVWDSREAAVERREFVIALGLAESVEIPAESDGEALASLFARWSDPSGSLRALAALPFDERLRPSADWPDDRARLVIPQVLLTATAGGVRVLQVEGSVAATRIVAWLESRRLQQRSAPVESSARVVDSGVEAFSDRVRAALARIESGDLEKVVVSRTVELRGSFKLAAALGRLAGLPRTVRFAWSRDGRWLIGATPETLLEKSGSLLRTEAVAGSLPRGADDEGEARALLASPKDRREHAFVVDAIRAALEERGVHVEAKPCSVRTLAHVHHLVTPMLGRVTGEHCTAVSLAEALHPTPAMNGVPRTAALDFLREREPHRGFYAAPIGLVDRRGDGIFAVAIRSALLSGERAQLFAGVGVVAGSSVNAEVAETEAKLASMIAALGVTAEERAV